MDNNCHIQMEQSFAHVPIKQSKPVFLDKLRKICVHINTELNTLNSKLYKRFLYLRDQAFFKLQFFAGDRAHDLSLCVAQEVKKLPDGKGLLFCHTVGKTLKNGKVNEFVVKKLNEEVLCPVEGLYRYVNNVGVMDIDVTKGFLFRALDASRTKVLESPVSSSGMSERLQNYLIELNIFEGETPHGIRGGCAITLMSTGVASCQGIMDHVGWLQKDTCNRYSRVNQLVDSTSVSSLFAKVADADFVKTHEISDKLGNVTSLDQAF
ncbi:uncharacterized protein LOC134725193 [Mytilus trossulus]|uniref:uncharacterized protein LOC134725193 n=1 Tax=Mytilus trossulus TaxID=6551 RepID=UPI00300414D9